jgi:hypothetical protein
MPYQVDRFNGTFLVSVDDGTIDTTTDIRFVGKNYAGYGEVQNENFLHLMENFANTSAPPKVVTGQIWFDSANKKLKFYDGSKFRTAGGAESGTTAPAGLTTGDFWFDTSTEQLYAYNGTEFILIGPENSPDSGTSALVPQIVKDNVGVNHSIAKLLAGGEVIAVISKDAFTLDSVLNPITGFTVIKKGMTLVNTNGITGVTTTDHYFWGTAANALKLGNFVAEDFVRSSSAAFESGAHFSDIGITVGKSSAASADLKISVENSDEPTITSRLSNPLLFKIGGAAVQIITSSAVIPGSNLTYDLGSSGSKWNNVYSNTFVGSLTGNVTGNITGNVTGNLLGNVTGNVTGDVLGNITGNVIGDVIGTANNALTLNGLIGDTIATATTIAVRDSSGDITANSFKGIADKAVRLLIDNTAVDTDSYRSAKTTKTANTIAARDGSGNLLANVFDGTATAAQYADLAEKYLADKEYETGTVVVVGGEKEVTASSWGQRAIGVVSANPAFMMNKDLEGGTYIALKGRVPVKVVGAVTKGQRLIAADQGCAVAAVPHANDVFAIALESSSDISEKVIEAIVL